jgi:PIN domain
MWGNILRFMNECVLLVDYENVGKIDLGDVPTNVRVLFFFGASQKTVPTAFLKAALKLGERFVPIDIEGHGKNALDFHIAFYLGEFLVAAPETRCIVLSKDKGFDPLIRHLTGRGFMVGRAATLNEAFPSPAPAKQVAQPITAQTSLTDALEWLKDIQKNKRPRKRKGLVAHIYNHYGRKIPESDVQAFVDEMITTRQLSEVNGAISYHFWH